MSTIHFAIDQGNTRTKLAIYEGRREIGHFVFHGKQEEEMTLEKILALKATRGILSSVRATRIEFEKVLSLQVNVLTEGPQLRMPFEINYETPETLGSDRKANAAAFVAEFGSSNGLIIDCGTCITYTVIRAGVLEGGTISPGVSMRYNALHDYTGRLPLLKPLDEMPPLTGKSTSDSLRSGVERAIIGEVEKMIEQYCSHINDLIVILTGGDISYFERHLKSPIFARPLYTISGLNEIFLFNSK